MENLRWKQPVGMWLESIEDLTKLATVAAIAFLVIQVVV